MKIINVTLSKKFALLCLFMLSLTGFAQHSTVSLANPSPASSNLNTFEVDVVLTVLNPAGYRLVSVAFGVNYAPAILNGGTPCTTANCGSWAMIPGSRSPEVATLNASTNTNRATPVGHLRATMTNLVAASGIDLAPGSYTIGRYRFTNTVNFIQGSNANLWLQNVNTGGSTNTIVSFYPFGLTTPLGAGTSTSTGANGSITLGQSVGSPLSVPLNPSTVTCPTSGSSTQTAPSCLGNSNGSATVTMSPVPSPSLAATYSLDGGAAVPVTLSATGEFTINGLTAGSHTLSVTSSNAGCTAIAVSGILVPPGTDPGPAPTVACYETATLNSTTCTWDVTGTQPVMPTLACYETATFNTTTCVWDVTGTQPMMPTLACYETATFNTTTCVWDVTGTQPAMPTLACYETATFNTTTCVWDVTGTQPAMPTLACYETATFNTTTCVWDVTGTQPTMPTLACYETATFNTTTCVWDVTGTQPAPPTLLCYQTLGLFNNTTCTWDVTGTQPVMPTLACYETATFNTTTCVWDVTGTQPMMPTLACYETATFNNTTCVWDVTGTQPMMPTLACYETATFNNTTCVWDVTGTQPMMPTLACYETATFNNTTCMWDVTGTQPMMPTLACYETATFNTTTCMWDVTGTQPMMPTLACYETATFNNTTCMWDVTGTQPMMPTLACYETATFNTTTCMWDVTGTQPMMPTLACYETATFNTTTCMWDVTGTQPMMPTLACYETATFNTTTCMWDVTGTQPMMPTLACYETATFNTTTCMWDVTGTQPAPPTLLCYQTATFNNTTCMWDVTGTQPTLGSVTITAVGSYTWPLPFGTGLTYTTSQTGLTNLVGCNLATLNLTIATTVPTVNTFVIGSSCGATISGLNVTIIAAFGGSSYVFRVTNMVTSTVQLIPRPVNSFALSNVPGVTLGTPYQIEVSINGGPFGPPCLVNTPSPVSTLGAQCSTTLTSMSQFAYCTYVASATGYRFRITNTSDSSVQIYNNGLNRFNFNSLPARSFATTYFVEVALRNTDGTYLPYSVGCNITTPAFPTSEIVLSQCDYTATSNTQSIAAVLVSGATEYRFNLVNVSQPYSFSLDRPVPNFNLNMFSGLLPGTTYTVKVAVKIGGVWGPLTGKSCNLTTPGGTGRVNVDSVSNVFNVVSYPNPFAENFMLNVKTSSESTLQVRVYDMLGKQIENTNVEVSEIENLQVGSNYPSGVYNVIVSQAGNTQTLRVIKR